MQEQYFNAAKIPVNDTWNVVAGLKVKSKSNFLSFYVEAQMANMSDYVVRAVFKVMVNSADVAIPFGQNIMPMDNYNISRTCMYAPGFIPGEFDIKICAAAKEAPGWPVPDADPDWDIAIHKMKLLTIGGF